MAYLYRYNTRDYNFWSWKNKSPYYKHYTETTATATAALFALAFNKLFRENLNSAYIKCTPLRAVLARRIKVAISAKGRNRLGFATVKIRREISKHFRQCFPPSTFKRQNKPEEVAVSLSSCYEFSFQFIWQT